jgi:hypothetical protein
MFEKTTQFASEKVLPSTPDLSIPPFANWSHLFQSALAASIPELIQQEQIQLLSLQWFYLHVSRLFFWFSNRVAIFFVFSKC